MADGPEGVRQLLVAAIGCNVAWGIIDAVMYAMDCITVRSGKMRLVEAVQRAPDTASALKLVQNDIEPELQELLNPKDAEAMSQSVLKYIQAANISRTTVTKDDFYGAFASFLSRLCLVCAGGAAVSLFVSPAFCASCFQLPSYCASFLVGRKWARYVGTNGWLTGSVMVA